MSIERWRVTRVSVSRHTFWAPLSLAVLAVIFVNKPSLIHF